MKKFFINHNKINRRIEDSKRIFIYEYERMKSIEKELGIFIWRGRTYWVLRKEFDEVIRYVKMKKDARIDKIQVEL